MGLLVLLESKTPRPVPLARWNKVAKALKAKKPRTYRQSC
jgi:hypothetical protein